MAEVLIEALAKSFGDQTVLRGVDLSVRSGSLVAILGASGSGKSTLLRLLCGFERADAGIIRIDDRLVTGVGVHVPPEDRQIGYVAQEGALFPHLSVGDNIVFGLPRRQRRERERAAALLAMVGLPASYAARPPHELSGGEQQRVALARALAPSPRLVLLDEPFSSLDAGLRAETRQTVRAALAAAGATALLVTHDQSEALSVADQVAVLRGGRIAQLASPQILYRQPVDADIARFVGEAVLLPGWAAAGTANCCLGRLSLAVTRPEGAIDVLLRPEQIRLLPGHYSDGVPARVQDVTYYGHDASATLALVGEDREMTISARVPGHMCPRPGEDVRVIVRSPVFAYRAQSDERYARYDMRFAPQSVPA